MPTFSCPMVKPRSEWAAWAGLAHLYLGRGEDRRGPPLDILLSLHLVCPSVCHET